MRSARAPTWRWVRRGVVALLVGVVGTYASAWACALWSPLKLRDLPGCEVWPCRVPAEFSEVGETVEARGTGVWYLAIVGSDIGSGSPYGYIENARTGWPCSAVESLRLCAVSSANVGRQVDGDGREGWNIRGGLDVPAAWGRGDGSPHRLQLVPLWPGFGLNAVFYALVLSPLVWAPGMVRRWQRVRRGRCGACGYDVKGIEGGVCPECGGEVESKARGKSQKG